MATETSPTITAEPASVPYRRGEGWPVSFLEPLALTDDEERVQSAGLAALVSCRPGGRR
ncbi:hypothetical protein [Streptomyces niveus]|jgi:hypothetical protein|uniref:hypothetical protein n=1 Tax=Streptomyces niveus TaxID=193462 RepID=UPI0003C577D1|nr:hypothetical protein [Streptomyces niveus]EST28532.1 hypothetical protein M877_14525 [Streptomyces niveus NCIMB 11891]